MLASNLFGFLVTIGTLVSNFIPPTFRMILNVQWDFIFVCRIVGWCGYFINGVRDDNGLGDFEKLVIDFRK